MGTREHPRKPRFETVSLKEVRAALQRTASGVEKVTEKREPYSVHVNVEPRKAIGPHVRDREERRRRG